jgi:hypothetical protein
MISIFTCRDHAYTLRGFLKSWGAGLAGDVQLLDYEGLALSPRVAGGTVIFSDLERLSLLERQLAAWFYRQLREHGKHVVLLNNPAHCLNRAELLAALYANNINQFASYPIRQYQDVRRFPVFIRSCSEHNGSITPLLHNRAELQAALKTLPWRKKLLGFDFVIVEYIHSAIDGLFRKYSAMRIGNRIIPRHILFSNEWITKKPDLVDSSKVNEEAEFLRNFPHNDMLWQIFHLANIEYGRIDYGIMEGRIQVWEINSNPIIVPNPERIAVERLEGQRESARQIIDAFRGLGTATASHVDRPHHLSLPGQLLGLTMRARNRLMRRGKRP